MGTRPIRRAINLISIGSVPFALRPHLLSRQGVTEDWWQVNIAQALPLTEAEYDFHTF